MAQNNLYQVFNCSSKEELFSLIERKDESVSSLLNFIEFSKGDLSRKNKEITSPNILVDYARALEKPNNKQINILFVDIKNKPIHLEIVQEASKEYILKATRQGILASPAAAFLIAGTVVESEHIEYTQKLYEDLAMPILDTVYFQPEKNIFRTEKSGASFRGNLASDESEIYLNKEHINAQDNFANYRGFKEFAEYYATKKIKGLDIAKDIEKIKEILKVGWQHDDLESFNYITYNKNNTVLNVKTLSLGGLSQCTVDPKTFFKQLLTEDSLNGVMLFHNHPSGNPTPSREDIQITERIMGILKEFEIEFFDSLIIGKEKVLSLVKDKIFLATTNKAYKDSFMVGERKSGYKSPQPKHDKQIKRRNMELER